MAQCDNTCWAANNWPPSSEAESSGSSSSTAGGFVSGGLGAPGYNVQRVAYTLQSALAVDNSAAPLTCMRFFRAEITTQGAGPVQTSNKFPVSGIIGIVVAIVAVAGAGIVFWRYK